VGDGNNGAISAVASRRGAFAIGVTLATCSANETGEQGLRNGQRVYTSYTASVLALVSSVMHHHLDTPHHTVMLLVPSCLYYHHWL
jgi:hypothetical protein